MRYTKRCDVIAMLGKETQTINLTRKVETQKIEKKPCSISFGILDQKSHLYFYLLDRFVKKNSLFG